MSYGRPVLESILWYHRDVVAVQAQNPQVFQAGERSGLDALQLVVADNQGGESAKAGEHLGR